MRPVSFSDYASIIQHHTLDELMTSDLLKISECDALSSFYCPFDALSKDAKIVIVGICPGRSQWMNALTACKHELAQHQDTETVLKMTKQSAAFSGPIRKNLIDILDHLGLHQKLGLHSTASLFKQDQHLVQMSSVLRQAIFVNNQNYAGSSPNMLKHPFLLQHIHDYFIPEVQALPNTLYIPMGKSVIEVLHYISSLGYLQPSHILSGFPHPSGANAERIQYFLGRKAKETLSSKTNADKIDQAKANLIQQLQQIKL